ncbi:Rep protein [Brochothrix campestris FSL F6-1037]|uniref:Rep protein n=1 Tax=Brochothrix campestris FSL F6-1037 TaxID=1265861 RepID=W7CGQ0_9LIST|nr:Rep protein [Brochothrix campestris FSL F6-1037]
MLHGYNQKIIETPTYIEIWEYEQPILAKKKKL